MQLNSPAIDEANPTMENAFSTFMTRYGLNIAVDRNNKFRHRGDYWDIGAYEYIE